MPQSLTVDCYPFLTYGVVVWSQPSPGVEMKSDALHPQEHTDVLFRFNKIHYYVVAQNAANLCCQVLMKEPRHAAAAQ